MQQGFNQTWTVTTTTREDSEIMANNLSGKQKKEATMLFVPSKT